MQFALRHPDRCRALVLLVPAAWAPRPAGQRAVKSPRGVTFLFDTALRSDFLFWAAIRLARPVVTRTILGTPTQDVDRASPAEKARLYSVMGHILPVTSRRAGLINDAVVVTALPRYDLESIAVPTLAVSAEDCLYGTYDGARYTAEHVPHGRFVGYPTGGHLLVGHDQEALAEIASFLKQAP